jgi:hypothetical protein
MNAAVRRKPALQCRFCEGASGFEKRLLRLERLPTSRRATENATLSFIRLPRAVFKENGPTG